MRVSLNNMKIYIDKAYDIHANQESYNIQKEV